MNRVEFKAVSLDLEDSVHLVFQQGRRGQVRFYVFGSDGWSLCSGGIRRSTDVSDLYRGLLKVVRRYPKSHLSESVLYECIREAARYVHQCFHESRHRHLKNQGLV